MLSFFEAIYNSGDQTLFDEFTEIDVLYKLLDQLEHKPYLKKIIPHIKECNFQDQDQDPDSLFDYINSINNDYALTQPDGLVGSLDLEMLCLFVENNTIILDKCIDRTLFCVDENSIILLNKDDKWGYILIPSDTIIFK